MKLPSMKFRFPRSTGLKSWKNPNKFGSDAGENEKKFGEIGASDVGPGDRIPGNKLVLSIPSLNSNPSKNPKFSSACCCCFFPTGDEFAFSIVAYLAAGEIAPPSSAIGAEEDEAPVRRWTRFMKSLGFVWMILGETV